MIYLYLYLGVGFIILILLGLSGSYSETINKIYSGIVSKSESNYLLAIIISHLIAIFNIICLWLLFILSIKYINKNGEKNDS